MSENLILGFKTISEQYPNSIAILNAEDVKEMTYRELDIITDRVATHLIKKGIVPGNRIGVLVHSKFDWVILIIAIIKAGAAYVPVDPQMPEKYINSVLDSVGADLLITDGDEIHIPIRQTSIKEAAEEESDLSALKSAMMFEADKQLAYVMFTSGTTGIPKGVGVTHENIMNLVLDSNYISLSPDIILLQTGAPTFDASTFEVWGVLLNGGKLVLLDKKNVTDMNCLSENIVKYNISTMWLTAPLFNIIAEDCAQTFNGIKELIVGGDVVQPKFVNNVIENCDNIVVFNGYGPTECTTFSTTYRVDKKVEEDYIPIGVALKNVYTYICDESLHLVNDGEIGELYIGGQGVSLGYLNNEQLTNELFINNPFGNGRIYKTGDLVKKDKNGNIVFIGRKDRQVKINGFRIELEEVESIFSQIAGVDEAYVLSVKDRQNKNSLCAFIKTNNHTCTSLRDEFVKIAPSHISVSNIIVSDTTPLNNNGKVDYKKIKELFNDNTKNVDEKKENNNDLLSIIEKRIGITPTSDEVSFFELGLDSLTAVYIAKDLTKKMNIKISPKDILSNATMGKLSKHITSLSLEEEDNIIKEESLENSIPLANPQKALFADNIRFSDTTKYNIPIYIELDSKVDLKRLNKSIETVISRHEAFNIRFVMRGTDIHQEKVRKSDYNIKFVASDTDINTCINPFNLESGHLYRVYIGVDKDEPKWLLMDFHHIIMDGYSLQLVIKEIDEIYKKDEAICKTDNYAEAINEYNMHYLKHINNDSAFYNRYYQDYTGMEELPLDHNIQNVLSHENKCETFYLVGDVLERFRSECNSHNITFFEGFMFIYSCFLNLITGSKQVSFATPSRLFGNDILDKTVGMFTDTLWITSYFDNVVGKSEDINKFVNGLRELKEHRFISLEDIFALRKAETIDTLVTYHTKREMTVDFLDSNICIRPISPNEAMFLLNMQIFDEDNRVRVDIEYMADAFDYGTILALVEVFKESITLFIGS